MEEAYRSTGRTLVDPISYLSDTLGSTDVLRFIVTHPHMDHLSGLARLCQEGTIANLWDTRNNRTMSDDEWEGSGYRQEDWDCYQASRKREENPTVLLLHRNNTGHYWTEDSIELWSPTPELVAAANESGNHNNLSYVLRVSHNGRVVVLGGDAEKEVWSDILDHYGGERLKCDVLLAPHHGSKSAYHPEAVSAMSPNHVVVSVATGTQYAYAEYREHGEVLSTKWRGNIVFTINDDGEVSYTTQYCP